jgi:hypothetical protein
LGRLRQADVAVPASARSKPRQGRRS